MFEGKHVTSIFMDPYLAQIYEFLFTKTPQLFGLDISKS